MTHEHDHTAVHLEDVAYAYPDGTPALSGVSLAIAPGERVALLGPNGAGKSTLMLHLNGILRPTSGTVTVGGTRLTDASVTNVRRRVGLVFQDPDDQLFMTTVYDDVAFGPMNAGCDDAETDRRVHEALHAVGLAEVASKSGHHLSFGQRKRIALATVLAMRPDVLVLDEPTSNLDPRARRHMLELLGTLSSTMILATHDMDLAWELCDRAVVLDDGTIAAEGARDDVLTDETLLEEHGLELPWAVRMRHAD
ncbi:MAG: energy-coupling factor ABC transporter ATP-binding protein [Coriobacteriia bacterium]